MSPSASVTAMRNASIACPCAYVLLPGFVTVGARFPGSSTVTSKSTLSSDLRLSTRMVVVPGPTGVIFTRGLGVTSTVATVESEEVAR